MELSNRLEELSSHFRLLDTDLALRRLIDLGLDTQDIEIFKQILEYVNWHYSSYFKAESALEKVQPILDRISGTTLNTLDTNKLNLLELKDVKKRYAAGNFELGPINLTLKAGEVIGLVGQNGNGKTTLIRSIIGDLKLDSGKITYFNDPNLELNYDIRSQIAYVEQTPATWYGSLMENLMFTAAHHDFAPEENEWYVKMYIARLGLWPYKDFKWKALSGGYKMRFELARTLLRNPKILLLDEPLANLDIVSQQLILDDLRFIAQSKVRPIGILLSSQQLYEVEKISTMVLFLNNGKPQYQEFKKESKLEAASNSLIIEMESSSERTRIESVLSQLQLERIQFNGGTYLLHFKENTNFNQVLLKIGQSDLKVNYVRDISESSRRFFFN